MNKRIIAWASVAVIVVAGAILLALPKQESQRAPAIIEQGNGISIATPALGSAVSSPLTITGSAPGNWFFEATFPIYIVDWDGRIIGEDRAHATKDWMATGTVPFDASVSFTAPACGESQEYCRRGAIIFRNDNPSGDPSKTKSFELPVTFK